MPGPEFWARMAFSAEIYLMVPLSFESIPNSPMAYFSPALSFAVGPGNGNEVEIDDVSVSAFYSLEDKRQWITLFNEDFEQLKEKNGMENSGWRTKSEHTIESIQGEPGVKHLSIKPCEGEQVTVVKTFNVPVDFPFDISDKTFEIRYNEAMFSESAAYDFYASHGGSGISAGNYYSSSASTLSNSKPGISRTSEMFNTYYIYTFDGKLLAEYDHNGNCVRDYIYFGDRLLAEYKPQTDEYFYYMTDQINSTRIITDANGNVVFSETYGPYGDVQKTWVNTYNPKLKFSGKEREGYSDLDYFGARYYDHKSYRFNSVDPFINKGEALINPQLWNLYSFCRNNPITYIDTTGMKDKPFNPKTDKPVSEQPGTATPRVILNSSGNRVANKEAYNCHSYAWHDSKGDPSDPRNSVPVSQGVTRWDDNPDDDMGGYKQISPRKSNIKGDRVIYYIDANRDGKWSKGEYIVHSAIVVEVDRKGYTTAVKSKMGDRGISTNHPNAPGFYGSEQGYSTSRAYFRKKK